VNGKALSNDGAFHTLESWDAETVMRLFRERLLARFVGRHAISEDFNYCLTRTAL